MKFQERYGFAICLILSLGSSGIAQNRKVYDGQHFSLQYPSEWTARELGEGSVLLTDIPDGIPIFEIMVALIPGTLDLDRNRALSIIREDLSTFAAQNGYKMSTELAGPGDPTLIEAQSTFRSGPQPMDAITSVGLRDHLYINILYEPGQRETALKYGQALTQTIRIKGSQPPASHEPAAQQPERTDQAAAAWKMYQSRDFSISYPGNWTVSTETQKFTATDPLDTGRSISIEWRPGVENKRGILNQCASIDELLTWFYKRNYESLDSGRRQYPFTSVTHDDFQPGRLGGQSTNVSIVYQAAYQLPVTRLVNVQVVPRAGGAYIVTDSHRSEPMQVHEPFRLSVFKSIVFKSQPLDGKAYCNYLGR